MHFFAFFKSVDQQQSQQQELMISDEVMDEPPEGEQCQAGHGQTSSFLDDSFEIISDEEVTRVKLPFCPTTAATATSGTGRSSSPIWTGSPPIGVTPSSSTATLISNRGSSSSLSSAGSDLNPPSSSVISRKSLSFLFRNKGVSATCQAQLALQQILAPVVEKPKKTPPQLTEEEMTSSTTRIWYIIQLQGHYNHGLEETEEEEEGWYCHPPTPPPSKYRETKKTMENSSGNGTNWISSLLHLPERIKQFQADKNRFNVYAISDEGMREELKHLYVY